MRSAAAVLGLTLMLVLCSAPAAVPVAEDTPAPAPPVEVSLPKYLTEAERGLPLPTPTRDRPPPTGEVYCPPEYAPCDGLFIAWEGYTEVLTPMVVGITTQDPSAIVWVVVDSASEQTSATTSLTAAGADMSQVQFIIRTTDTVWIRDYGPRFILDDGARAIIDHTYNRPRPNDDAFNDYLATLWGVPQYDIGLTHGGGNFHLFANGDAFMTTLILNENPGYTAQQIKDLYLAYQNLNLTIYTGFPTSYDSTQHIDMWMLPLGDYKVIIGQYPASYTQPYAITEGAVTDLQSRGYTVYRTPGWNSGGSGGGGTHYTYTNAVILNNQVFISKFNVSQDAQALAVFQAAMPGYTIHQVDSSSIIGAAGAMHCIVMHVPTVPPPGPTVDVVAPNGGELWVYGEERMIQWTAEDDLGVTGVDIYLSTDGGATWPHTLATGIANTGSFPWIVGPPESAQCLVKVVAHDADGHTGDDESDAVFHIVAVGPRPVHRFLLDTDPGWPCQGQWAFGHPTGGGGAHGYPDPTSGFTGDNVYGVNLAGDYSTTAGGPWYLTLGPLDLTDVTETTLRFRRWLNTDFQPYARAWVHYSLNGSTWTQLWTNGAQAVTDSAWILCEYELPANVDNAASVWFRWGYQVGTGAWAYSGWNVDDVEVWGLAPAPPVCRGDANCDGSIGFADIDYFVAAIPNNQAAWAALFAGAPSCSFENCDVNADSNVGFNDIDPFVALIPSACP